MIAEGELTIGYLIYAAVCGLTAVFMARRKNRGAGLWFILDNIGGVSRSLPTCDKSGQYQLRPRRSGVPGNVLGTLMITVCSSGSKM